jgi:hypothetical protein
MSEITGIELNPISHDGPPFAPRFSPLERGNSLGD